MPRHAIYPLFASLVVAAIASTSLADRPTEERTEADYVLTGKVDAVYKQDTEGYVNYIVELRVASVEKGKDIKSGEVFRAYCYQRKEGKSGLEFDTAGHDVVPKEGATVKIFVKRQNGRHEGIYPHWIDVMKKAPTMSNN
jgi:hypothetical protein